MDNNLEEGVLLNKKTIKYKPENLTGLRDIIFTHNYGNGIKRTFTHTDIHIRNKGTKWIKVEFDVSFINENLPLDDPDRSSFTHKKYVLKDTMQIEEYEFEMVQTADEEGNITKEEVEIPNTRVVLKEAESHLTDWDSLVGELFSMGIESQIRHLYNILQP